jgi:MFS family permease
VVVVLPLAFGIVMGILILNNFGHLLPRRRIIEFGLMALGILLFLIAAAGPISTFLGRAEVATGLDSLGAVTSLLAIVVFIALLAGIAYAFVAIPSQTQLQEDLPEDVRGRVFGVLNMLVSTASFLPILIVGPVADVVGTTVVIYAVGVSITVSGVLSYVTRGPLKPSEAKAMAIGSATPAGFDPVAVATASSEMDHHRPRPPKPGRTADATGEDYGVPVSDEAPAAQEKPTSGEVPVLDEPGAADDVPPPSDEAGVVAGRVDPATVAGAGRGDPIEDE